MHRRAIDENGNEVDIADVPQDKTERHRHTYECPDCHGILIAHKGSHNVHHFKHKSGTDCDRWSQGMSTWHANGQDRLAALGGRTEVACGGDGFFHRADVVFDRISTVVELQHSQMSLDTFLARNEHYLSRYENLIWLFDARVQGRDIERRISFWDEERDTRRTPGDPWAEYENRHGLHAPECANPPGWLCEVLGDIRGWTGRGLSLALYVGGGDGLDDGHVLELFPMRTTPHDCSVHVWTFDKWAKTLAAGNLPFMRRCSARLHLEDGTIEDVTGRYGSTLPPARNLRDLPRCATRRWVGADGTEDIVPGRSAMSWRGTTDLYERVEVPVVGVAVWLSRRSRARRRPDASMRLPANTPMAEVVKRARAQIGEWRADDYDWGVLPNREFLERDVAVTLPVKAGRRRNRLAVWDGDTGELICEAWEYETASRGDALAKARKSLPKGVRDEYAWDIDRSDAPLAKSSEVRIWKHPHLRQISVRVDLPGGRRIWSGVMSGTASWAEVRDAVLAGIPQGIAERCDFGDLPSEPLGSYASPVTWVVAARLARVSVRCDGRSVCELRLPIGMRQEGIARAIEASIPDMRLYDSRGTLPDRITGDTTVELAKNASATHRIHLIDQMRGIPVLDAVRLPCWQGDGHKVRMPDPLPELADSFDGLYATVGGRRTRITDADGWVVCDDEELQAVRNLFYGYRRRGRIALSEQEMREIDDSGAPEQGMLF